MLGTNIIVSLSKLLEVYLNNIRQQDEKPCLAIGDHMLNICSKIYSLDKLSDKKLFMEKQCLNNFEQSTHGLCK